MAIITIGCSHKPDDRDAKIAKLEMRVSDMETRYDKLTAAMQASTNDLAEAITRGAIVSMLAKEADTAFVAYHDIDGNQLASLQVVTNIVNAKMAAALTSKEQYQKLHQ